MVQESWRKLKSKFVGHRPLGRPEVAARRPFFLESLEGRILLSFAGDLDPAFGGGDGIVTTAFLQRALIESTEAVTVQTDGKLLLAGSATDGFGRFFPDLLLVRLNADGSPDTSFGASGQVLFDFGGQYTSREEAFSVAVQTDGKIVVAGRSALTNDAVTPVDYDFALARFNADGSVDAGFGTGGWVRTDFGTTGDAARGLKVLGDGTIYVCGEAGADAALAKYTSAGVLDASFGAGGKVTVDFGGGDTLRGLAVQGDGMIVAAGTDGKDFAVARFTTLGALDAGFGAGGFVLTDFGSTGDEARTVALDAGGRIVAGGTAGVVDSRSKNDFALARYTAAGVLDASFGAGGEVTFDVAGGPDSGGPERIEGLAIQGDGKIVVAGTAPDSINRSQWAAARVDAAGALDPAFGAGGVTKLKLDTATTGTVGGMALSGGELIIAGTRLSDAPLDSRSVGVMKLTTAGALDPAFGDNGVALFNAKAVSDSAATASFLLDDGTLLVASRVSTTPTNSLAGSHITLNRYLLDGTPDPAFGTGGSVAVDLGFLADQANSLIVQPDGKIVIGGARYVQYDPEAPLVGDVLLARLNADGSPDTSFGSGGAVTPTFYSDGFPMESDIMQVLRQPDGKLLALGEAKGTVFQVFVLRYLADGAPDTTFGDGGRAVLDLGSGAFFPNQFTRLADGRVVLVGRSAAGEMLLARLLADGALDPSFGAGGVTRQAFAGSMDQADALIVETDGSLTVGGVATFPRSGASSPEIAHFTADGNLDTAFGTGGRVIGSVKATDLGVSAFTRDSAGRYLFATETGGAARLLRFGPDGALDQHFGEDTGVDLGAGQLATVAGFFVRPGGQLLVVGSPGPLPRDIVIEQIIADSTPSPNGLLSFSRRFLSVGGRNGSALIPVVREGGSAGTVTIHYEVTGGTAQAGLDYTPVSGDLTFDPGVTVMNISLPLLAVNPGEPALTVELTLSNPTGGAAQQYPKVNTFTLLAHNGPLGTIDPSFGANGVGFSDHTPHATSDGFTDGEQITSMAFAADGKIVAVGYNSTPYGHSGSFDWLVSRFNSDGTPDTTFSGDGSVITVFKEGFDVARTVAVQPDGKIIVAGTMLFPLADSRHYPGTDQIFVGDQTRIAFARYNGDGSLDRTFGDGGLISFDPATLPGLTGVEPQTSMFGFALMPSGDLLVGARVTTVSFDTPSRSVDESGLIRFHADGSLDTTFAGDGFAEAGGLVLDAVGGAGSISVRGVLTLLPDGKALLAAAYGDYLGGVDDGVAVVQFNADGTLDSTFGAGGIVKTSVFSNVDYQEIPRSLAIQSDGKILLAGHTITGTFIEKSFLLRYNANGTLDTTFDSDGIVLPDGVTQLYGVAPLPSGKVAAVGINGGGQAVVAQYRADGTPDPLFGIAGLNVLGIFHSGDGIADAAVLISPENQIVAGFGARLAADTTGNTQFALVRLQTDAPPGRLQFSASAVSFDETEDFASVSVLRSGGSGGNVTVHYETTSGTATAGLDFIGVSGTLNFADGETVQEILVPIVHDNILENTETFTVTLSAPTDGATLGAVSTETVSIVDGPDRFEFLSPVFSFLEGNSLAAVQVVRKGGATGAVSVDYTLQGVEAVNGVDFDAAEAGTLYFAAGQKLQTITFALRNDNVSDGKETIALALANPQGGPVLGTQATATVQIFDFDAGHGNNSGGLDSTFGTRGVSHLDVFTAGTGEQSYDVALQADGKLVVVGESGGPQSDFLVARYSADGSLDSSFGAGGVVSTDFFGHADSARSVAIDPDGKIVAAGWALRDGIADFAVARYLPDGSPDPSFSADGKTTVDFARLDDRASSVALTPDGKIVVGGWTSGALLFDMAVTQLNDDGSLDTTFNGTGEVTADFSHGEDRINAILVQPDGMIVAAGSSLRYPANGSTATDIAIIRLTPAGAFDKTFSGDGRVLGNDNNGPTTSTAANTMALRPNGDLIFGGGQNGNLLLSEYDPSGKLLFYVSKNLTFSQQILVSSTEAISDLALQPDGSLILVGGTRLPGEDTDRLFVVKVDDRFRPDTDFGLRSEALVQGVSPARAVALTTAGDIVTTGDGFEVARVLGHSHGPAEGVFFLDSFAYPVDEAAGHLTVTVSRPHEASRGRVTVDYVLVGMSAVPGQDFTPVSGTLVFEETETKKTFSIPIINDSIFEWDETFGILLTNPTGGAQLSSVSFATVTIPKNDVGGTPGIFSFPNGSGGFGFNFVSEQFGFGFVTITRSGGSLGAISVDYATADGTAKAGQDYVPQFGTLSYAAGQTSAMITLQVIPDDAIEGDETFFIKFSAPRGGSALSSAFNTVTVTIPDYVSPAEDLGKAGLLDTTFGTNGLAQTSSGVSGGDTFYNLARQADGKFVAVGKAGDSGGLFVVRYNADGSLDPTFGAGGKVITSLGSAGYELGIGVRVQSDGKILVIGADAGAGLTEEIVLARYTSAGVLDKTFGSAGLARTPLQLVGSTFFFLQGNGEVALTPDGGFVVGTYSKNGLDSDLELLRFTAKGALDPTFGVGGAVTFDTGLSNDLLSGLVVQPDGKVLATFLAGTTRAVRFNNDGTIDTGFGAQGLVNMNVAATLLPPGLVYTDNSTIAEPLLLPGGDFLLFGGASGSGHPVGSANVTASLFGLLMLRFHGDGTPDTSFGTNGAKEINLSVAVNAAMLDEAGKIVLVGGSGAARLLPDGRPDIGFGDHGIGVTSGIGRNAFAGLVQPDGRVVIAGGDQFSTAGVGALARYVGGPAEGEFRLNILTTTVSEDGGSLVVPVQRIAGLDGAVSVTFSTSDDTAQSPADYTAVAQAVSWADREAGVKTVTIPIINDTIFQGNLTFHFTLSSPTGGATLSTRTNGTATILDDEQPGRIEFSDPSFSVAENGGTATITVHRAGGKGGAVSADYAVTGGTAITGVHYSGGSGTVHFADGETDASFTVPIIDNLTLGEDQTVVFTLSNVQGGAVLGNNTSTRLTIVDNEVPLGGTFGFGASRFEVREDGGGLLVTVLRTGGSDGAATVTLTAAAGTAVAGRDFVPFTGILPFDAGETSHSIFIPVFDNNRPDGDHTVLLSLSEPTGDNVLTTTTAPAIGPDGSATLVILDNDARVLRLIPGEFQLLNSAVTARERDGAAHVVVLRQGGFDGAANVDLVMTEGTAKAGRDFTGTTIHVQFAAGELSKTVSIPVRNDFVNEPTETFTATLENLGTGTSLGPQTSATIRILDDDPCPLADFNNDGNLDLVLFKGSKLMLHLGNGNGGFGAATLLPALKGAKEFLAADFTGDGNADLVVLSPSKNSVFLLKGNGNGTFAAPVAFPGAKATKSLVAADFNGDGRLDLAVLQSKGVNVLLNNGAGGFGAARTTVAGKSLQKLFVGDFNGDGRADLAVINGGGKPTVTVRRGDGSGKFTPAIVSPFAPGFKVASALAADLTGDGFLDLAVIVSKNQIAVLAGNRSGRFAAPTLIAGAKGAQLMAAGDFNDDLALDLVTTAAKKTAVAIVNSGSGTFFTPVLVPMNFAPKTILTCDVNGDGDPDLVFFDTSDHFKVALGAAGSGFTV